VFLKEDTRDIEGLDESRGKPEEAVSSADIVLDEEATY